MPPKMSRRQQDHIAAKMHFREITELARERNPKLMGEHPDKWTTEFAYIQGWLKRADDVAALVAKVSRTLDETHASTAEGQVRLKEAIAALGRLV